MESEARPTPQPGRFGRFYLQELINSGGMADIWVATDPQGRPFALRRLHDDLRHSFLARRRFARGCKILAQIHEHDKVIRYIEHGKIEGTPYLLMEYVEGSNLKQLLGRNDPALAENVAQIIIDMAVALEHVHESGFIHLDYKPENVLVTRNGSVRLVDFDLAQPKPEQPQKMSRQSWHAGLHGARNNCSGKVWTSARIFSPSASRLTKFSRWPSRFRATRRRRFCANNSTMN